MKPKFYTDSSRNTTEHQRRAAQNTNGVFAVDRGIFRHPAFAEEPFTEREAWLYLVSEAAWKPHRCRAGSFVCDLSRGQLVASVRFLADRWQWDRSRTHRFLLRLKREEMIETSDETGISVISICNYDAYQRVSLPSETYSETATRQQRDKLEYKEGKETSSLRSEAHARATRLPEDWRPSEPDKTYARQQGLNDAEIDKEAENFRDFWRAKARDNTKLDWSATWRRWIRDSIERLHRGSTGRRPAIEGCDQLRAAIDKGYELPPAPAI